MGNDKIRVNPGNFADGRKTFEEINYDDPAQFEAAFRDAEARERLAQADAKATEMLSVAVANGDPAALNYYIAEKYVKAFETMGAAPNQKVVLMPYEGTALLSSLAGIGEIAKGAFGTEGAPRFRPTRARWRRRFRRHGRVGQQPPSDGALDVGRSRLFWARRAGAARRAA